MLYETWKYNLNQTDSSYQQQMKVNSYVIAQEINNNPLSRFSEVTRKSFLNYTVQKYGGTDYILLKNGQEVVNLTGYTLVSGEDARFNDQDPAYVLQKTDNRHLLVMGQTLKTEKKEKSRSGGKETRESRKMRREVEKRIGALEKRLEELEGEMEECGSDHVRLAALYEEKEEAENELLELYEKQEEFALLAEE